MNTENKDNRPALDSITDSRTFLDYYWLKEELCDFCRANGLPASGSKAELTERISVYLDKGEIISSAPVRRRNTGPCEIGPGSIIEPDIVCSEKHRTFFKKHIGSSFSFNVAFQKWLKANAGRTYGEAIEAYRDIVRSRKNKKSEIDSQFEYNTYIRDFFAENKGRTLKDAIKCWRYKKSLSGHNRYEKADLVVLDNEKKG